MHSISIQGASGKSRIDVGTQMADVGKLVGDRQAVIVTDPTVRSYYGGMMTEYPVIEAGLGEAQKSLSTLERLVKELLSLGADRRTFLLGFGGGIVCDVTGFLASTYMRGIDFGFVSTSLLSMVDASVGGKNGVNCGGFKNIVGNFNQPAFVCCDIALLDTLPSEELSCGFAEIVKHCLIADAAMFDWLEECAGQAVSLESEVIERLVMHSVETKAAIVNRDEKESGERRKLNFGHTFGHALEACKVVQRHGEAVSLGMVVAARISLQRGLISEQELMRIIALLQRLGLRTALPQVDEKVFQAMGSDKKREGKEIHAVLLDGIGRAFIERVPMTEFESAVRSVTS